MFDAAAVRREFPILDQQVHGHPLVYLDNANTTQKPLSVIEALDHYYRADNANIHRATHLLSERATKAYEGARERIARFFNAQDTAEIVFTRGCTGSRATRSWSRTWSTTPTSCRGSSWPSRPAPCSA
jgi:cysteine desulfurase / selenocysteine lyase